MRALVLSPGTTMSLVLDARSAQRIVDAAGLVFSVTTCTRLHGGVNSAAYKLVDAEEAAHLVVKVYGERMAWKMGKEVLVYGLEPLVADGQALIQLAVAAPTPWQSAAMGRRSHRSSRP